MEGIVEKGRELGGARLRLLPLRPCRRFRFFVFFFFDLDLDLLYLENQNTNTTSRTTTTVFFFLGPSPPRLSAVERQER